MNNFYFVASFACFPAQNAFIAVCPTVCATDRLEGIIALIIAATDRLALLVKMANFGLLALIAITRI